jgi:hypothetical protein
MYSLICWSFSVSVVTETARSVSVTQAGIESNVILMESEWMQSKTVVWSIWFVLFIWFIW